MLPSVCPFLGHLYLPQNGKIFQLGKSSIRCNATPVHDQDPIGMLDKIESVGDHEYGLPLAVLSQGLEKEKSSDMRVHRTQDIVEEQDIGIGVECPRESDTRFLPSGKSASSLADHCLIAFGQDLKICL
jgi:hypothetical protein